MLRSKILIYLLLVSSLFGAKYLAVLDLDPEGLSASEAKILTQRLTSKIIELGDYTVVERANLDKVLAEMKFQTTSGLCSDSKCAVEIGQMAGADLTVVGTASKFGETYTIDARLIDVESGSALASASFTHTGKIDELVKDGIESIAHNLLGIPYKKKISSEPTSKASSGYGATLDISSDPPGAEVYIGGNYFDTTPLILEDFPAGDYEVQLKLDGYEDYAKSVNLLPRGTENIYARLQELPAYIKFTGSPRISEVTVFINNKKQQGLNLYGYNNTISPGKHFIRISKENHFDYLDTVIVKAGNSYTIDYTLKKNAGYLKLYISPKGTQIYVNDKIGSKYNELPPGTHKLKVSKLGYNDYTGEVEIKLHETTELDVKLNRQYGHLDLKLSPYNAKVYFNDSLAMELELPSSIVFDNNTVEFKLKPGTYDVRAEKPFYLTKTLPATIKNKERTTLTLALEPKSRSVAKKKALLFPGLGHKYADASKGQKWLILGAASVIGTAYMGQSFLSNIDAFDSAQANYLAATEPTEIERLRGIYQSALDDKKTSLIGTAGFGAAYVVVWIWNIFDINSVIPSEIDLRADVHLNKTGQLEASIAF